LTQQGDQSLVSRMTRHRFAMPCSFSSRKTARRYGFQGLLNLHSLAHRFQGFAAKDQNFRPGAVFSRMPRRAPQLLNETARRGDAGMHRVAEGAGSPFRQPPAKARNGGDKRRPGVFSFGYFSLDKQRKVSRLSVREPTLKPASRPRNIINSAINEE
jgi:hypothetical protein